jgi:hypothetical protein
MVDFSRLFELASGLFSNTRAAESLNLPGAMEGLAASGLDIANLSGLSPEEIVEALAGQGIDALRSRPASWLKSRPRWGPAIQRR